MNNTAINETTGDSIKTKPSNDVYRDGWERIYGKGKANHNAGQGDDTSMRIDAETLRQSMTELCTRSTQDAREDAVAPPSKESIGGLSSLG